MEFQLNDVIDLLFVLYGVIQNPIYKENVLF